MSFFSRHFLGMGTDSPVKLASLSNSSPDNKIVSHGINRLCSIAYMSPGNKKVESINSDCYTLNYGSW